jgi:hypothetical protein
MVDARNFRGKPVVLFFGNMYSAQIIVKSSHGGHCKGAATA